MNTPFIVFRGDKVSIMPITSNRVRIAYRRPDQADAKADPELTKKFEFMRKMDPPNDQWKAAEELLKHQGLDVDPIIDYYMEACEAVFSKHPDAYPRSSISIEPLGDSGEKVVRFRILIGLAYLDARLQRQFMKCFSDKGRLYASVCIYHEPL